MNRFENILSSDNLFRPCCNQDPYLCCWYDKQPIGVDNPIFALPLRYNENQNTWTLKGCFCSWACMKSYLHEYIHQNIAHITHLMNKLIKFVHCIDSVYEIPKAYHWKTLKCYGGYRDLESYRKDNKVVFFPQDCNQRDTAERNNIESDIPVCLETKLLFTNRRIKLQSNTQQSFQYISITTKKETIQDETKKKDDIKTQKRKVSRTQKPKTTTREKKYQSVKKPINKKTEGPLSLKRQNAIAKRLADVKETNERAIHELGKFKKATLEPGQCTEKLMMLADMKRRDTLKKFNKIFCSRKKVV